MIREGQIAVFAFPQTDQRAGKLRPALVVRRLPGNYNDWLICMISTQLSHLISGFDDVIADKDPDFPQSGLKASSLIRISRLAVVNGDVLLGSIGNIGVERLRLVKTRISQWITGT